MNSSVSFESGIAVASWCVPLCGTSADLGEALEISEIQCPDGFGTKERKSAMQEDLLSRVEIDPEVMLGKPVIRGTRITLEIILEKIAAGCSFDEILEEYPRLGHADVLAAIAYAS